MYEMGEYVVHPGQGVCRVEEIVQEPQPSYTLLPIMQTHAMKISFPVANEDRLRPVLSGDEAQQIIDDYATMEPEEHEERSNALEEQYYRAEIRNGDCRDSVRIVKTIRMRIADLAARNKKPPVAYERILKRASERAVTELAISLGISRDEVISRFDAAIGGPVNG